jgi:hypothetical protein
MSKYPDDGKWFIKMSRFINILDDDDNKLSPVKFNVWGANLGAVSAFAATAASWMGAHIPFLEQGYTLIAGWMAHAHTAHHFDKKERNTQAVRLKEIK